MSYQLLQPKMMYALLPLDYQEQNIGTIHLQHKENI